MYLTQAAGPMARFLLQTPIPSSTEFTIDHDIPQQICLSDILGRDMVTTSAIRPLHPLRASSLE